ncbi:MAG TPA: hypothetical protein ENJ64_01330 [Thiotrichales bacterium]|nr:hypothetical protein [Thiotrichales bacterium]
MNIFYIGSSGALSLLPFKALLDAGHRITAVGIHRPIVFRQKVIALENESLALAASQHETPVVDLAASVDEVLQQCAGYRIDVILMACYSRRLPMEIATLAAKGCFNLHPSLLPAFRGPEPIFWQLKNGSETGVSWHCVTPVFDAGDIVAQQAVTLADGLSYNEINRCLATSGAEQMYRLLDQVERGCLVRSPQPAEQASYYRYPQPSDFIVDTAKPARQLFNFMRATEQFGQRYYCRTGGQNYWLTRATAFDAEAHTEEVEKLAGERLRIPCKQGVLIAAYTGRINQRPPQDLPDFL